MIVSRRARALALWDKLAADELAPAADMAFRRKLLRLPPRIDKDDLAKRLLNGGTLHQHEREFLAGWLKGRKQNPRHRPPSAETAIKADEVAQFVFYWEAIDPDVQRKEVCAELKAMYGVSPRYVRDVLEKIDPERKRHLMTSAAIFVAMLDEVKSGTEAKT